VKKRPIVTIFVVVLVVAVTLLASVWHFQRKLIYMPFGQAGPASSGLPRAEDVSFTTADGLRLNGWFALSDAGAHQGTVLIFNGNAGNRSFRAPLARGFRRRGFSVLLFDYRGYAGNPGSPGEAGLLADGRAARAYLESRPDVDPSRIYYFAESLGAGVAVGIAAEHPPAALVLRSPFTSLVDAGKTHYPFLPVGTLLKDRFDSIDRIQRVECPVMVILGTADRIVPPELSLRLFEAVPHERKRLLRVAGADHNDRELTAGDEVVAPAAEFMTHTWAAAAATGESR